MAVPLLRTLILYCAVICAVRLMGKRQIGELDPSELVVTILVSDLAAVPMQDLGIPLLSGLVPIATLVVLEIFLSFAALKSRRFRRLLNGQPAIIIRRGQLDIGKLRQMRLTTDEVIETLRKQNVAAVSDVKYVVIEPDGMRGVEQFRTVHPSLVLLDVMLPGLDGWGVCRAIRAESQTPIIMLTAKSETEDKVNGLKQGADDYITKPFEMKEVLARIEAVLRRSGIEPEKSRRRLEFDKLIIDMDAFELTVDGKKVPTPPKEMELLYHLASTPNRVYTRNQLLDEVWGFDYFGDTRTVDVHIKRLREKLEGVSDQWDLKTVWSVGYKFEVK